jgi:hypothetical protein
MLSQSQFHVGLRVFEADSLNNHWRFIAAAIPAVIG